MKEIEILLTDFAIEPKEIRVPVHEPVRFLVSNFGSKERRFAVLGEECGVEEQLLKPGQTKALELVFTAKGSFKTACTHCPSEGQDVSGWLYVED